MIDFPVHFYLLFWILANFKSVQIFRKMDRFRIIQNFEKFVVNLKFIKMTVFPVNLLPFNMLIILETVQIKKCILDKKIFIRSLNFKGNNK